MDGKLIVAGVTVFVGAALGMNALVPSESARTSIAFATGAVTDEKEKAIDFAKTESEKRTHDPRETAYEAVAGYVKNTHKSRSLKATVKIQEVARPDKPNPSSETKVFHLAPGERKYVGSLEWVHSRGKQEWNHSVEGAEWK